MDEQLRKLISCIFEEHQDGGIDCETCSMQLNCLAEMVARGAAMTQILPAVTAHLECCPDCREEYEALLCIMIAEDKGLLASPSTASSEESSTPLKE